jgi:uncharacterized membrane protein
MARTMPETAEPEGAGGATSSAVAAGWRGAALLRRPAVPHVVLAALFFAAYAVLEIARYARFGSMSWDLAIFVQEVRGYAELHAPVADIKGAGYNILGDHFSPILAVLAPFYRVFPSAVTLLVAQSALFASSVGVVSDTAARFLGRARGLATGLAYGLSWGLLGAVDFDFHEICFAVPLIAVALRMVLLERWYAAALWAMPLVLVKEDMGLTVAALGVLVVLRGRERALGAILACFGVGMLLLTVLVVIPHFNPGGTYDYWSKVPGGSVFGTLEKFFTPSVKIETLAWTFGITAFLCLRSPLLLVALPTFAWRFVSSNDAYWGRAWHYSAVLMPVVFLAMVDGVVRAEGSRFGWLRGLARSTVPAATAIALTLSPQSPIADLFSGATYDGGTHAAAARAALAAVPAGATVESNITLMAHLAARDDVFWIGGSTRTPPQYLALDLSYGWSPSAPTDLPGYGRALHPGTTWQVVFEQDQIAVVKRVG